MQELLSPSWHRQGGPYCRSHFTGKEIETQLKRENYFHYLKAIQVMRGQMEKLEDWLADSWVVQCLSLGHSAVNQPSRIVQTTGTKRTRPPRSPGNQGVIMKVLC